MREYILSETNWKSVQDTDFSIAILPWSATEAHNYHLPYGTDTIEADHIAAESAKLAWEQGCKVIVLPTIPFGVNTGQSDIKLDMNLNPSTQLLILLDIVETLNRQGIHKLFILNSHGGNDFKPLIREVGLKYPRMLLSVCNWFHFPAKGKYFEKGGDHADEMETSLLLFLEPHLVRPLSEAGSGHQKRHKIEAYSEGWVWTERKWSQVTEDTGIGDPQLATKEKGAAFFKAVTRQIATTLIELELLEVNQMYE